MRRTDQRQWPDVYTKPFFLKNCQHQRDSSLEQIGNRGYTCLLWDFWVDAWEPTDPVWHLDLSHKVNRESDISFWNWDFQWRHGTGWLPRFNKHFDYLLCLAHQPCKLSPWPLRDFQASSDWTGSGHIRDDILDKQTWPCIRAGCSWICGRIFVWSFVQIQ